MFFSFAVKVALWGASVSWDIVLLLNNKKQILHLHSGFDVAVHKIQNQPANAVRWSSSLCVSLSPNLPPAFLPVCLSRSPWDQLHIIYGVQEVQTFSHYSRSLSCSLYVTLPPLAQHTHTHTHTHTQAHTFMSILPTGYYISPLSKRGPLYLVILKKTNKTKYNSKASFKVFSHNVTYDEFF